MIVTVLLSFIELYCKYHETLICQCLFNRLTCNIVLHRRILEMLQSRLPAVCPVLHITITYMQMSPMVNHYDLHWYYTQINETRLTAVFMSG